MGRDRASHPLESPDNTSTSCIHDLAYHSDKQAAVGPDIYLAAVGPDIYLLA